MRQETQNVREVTIEVAGGVNVSRKAESLAGCPGYFDHGSGAWLTDTPMMGTSSSVQLRYITSLALVVLGDLRVLIGFEL
jgi:hypothetical protein